MTHFARELTDTEWANVPLDPTVIRNIDEKTKKAINGDDGGSWDPSAPIVIGGAGIAVLSPWAFDSSPDDVRAECSDESPIEFGGDAGNDDDAADVFVYEDGHDGTSRSELIQLAEVYTAAPRDLTLDTQYVCVQAAAIGARFLAPLRALDGSTIASVTFTIRVGQAHADVPAELPRFRVIRVDEDGNVAALASVADGADPAGWRYFAPTPASGAAWYASGNAQTFEYACDQNNAVDLSKHCFFVEVVEEQGTGAETTPGNRFVSAEATCTGIDGLNGRH